MEQQVNSQTPIETPGETLVESSTKTPAKKTPKTGWILGIIVIIILLLAVLVWGYRSMKSKQSELSTEAEISPIASPAEEVLPTEEPLATPTKKPTAIPTVAPTSTPTPIPSATSTPTPTPDPRADLYISEYSYNHPPKQGEAFTVKIGLYNQGNTNTGGFYWEWWPTHANFACRERISGGIVAHGGLIVNCTYTYGGWANYTVKAEVDADNEVNESNESNNVRTETLTPIH